MNYVDILPMGMQSEFVLREWSFFNNEGGRVWWIWWGGGGKKISPLFSEKSQRVTRVERGGGKKCWCI